MAVLDIKASQLRVRESAELQAAIQSELVIARATIEDKDKQISDLLNEQTKSAQTFHEQLDIVKARQTGLKADLSAKEQAVADLEVQLRESEKKNGLLIKKLDAKDKPTKKPEEGKPVVIKNDAGKVVKEIHTSKPKAQTEASTPPKKKGSSQ
jgi:hypothetical protein